MIYFDNAATTFIKPRSVFYELNRLSQICGSYGRSSSKPSFTSADIIYKAREEISDFFNFSHPENVVFTLNATYALNIAIKSLITEPSDVITSSFEHNSVIRPLYSLENVNVNIVKSKIYDNEDFLEKFKENITKNTKFAVINHVSNAFGYILPIKAIDEICFNHGIQLILDISQSAGIIPIDLSEFKSVVCVCMPAHKSLYGVLGVGIAIFTRDDLTFSSVIEGGTGSMSSEIKQPLFLPDVFESGTPNAPAIGALRKGIEYVSKQKNVQEYVFGLARYFATEMSKIPDTQVFFCDDMSLQSGVVSFNNSMIDCEELSTKLASFSVSTRAGVHCSPFSHEMVGTNGTVRASFSTFNTVKEIDQFVNIYKKICEK